MRPVIVFLCGDVMLGRGIDQVLPHPSPPELHEPYVRSALEYVEMAERASGDIPKPVDFPYVWGDALEELDRIAPDARIVNLETSITTSAAYVAKGINYRMHPANAPCLVAAKITCCVLANNHVLDWGPAGLAETLATLYGHAIKTAGAGLDLARAGEPAVIQTGENARILVFAVGVMDSGIPRNWAATEKNSGVALLHDLSDSTIGQLDQRIRATKQPGDLVILSIHWGENWGYRIPREHREFAHKLIDLAGVDLIHGHSCHHPKAIEVYRDKLILYACGDFLNDYEGIAGYETFRGNLVLMYFVTLDPATGHLLRLEMTPLEIKRFRLQRASSRDAEWLRGVVSRESEPFGPESLVKGASKPPYLGF